MILFIPILPFLFAEINSDRQSLSACSAWRAGVCRCEVASEQRKGNATERSKTKCPEFRLIY
jgi:hypothetical protein